ncbi:MAG: hypothetical protein PHS59_17730 [Paludibacter sp.]|nr:hypothetical protein [Paludibacter sp.]
MKEKIEKSGENDTPEIVQEKKESKFAAFILRHKMVFTLLVIIIILASWAFIKMAVMENRFEKQKALIITTYENKIDSLTLKHLELTSKVFSWAVRSELTRENKEQVNQFFLSFIQENNVKKVMFIDASTATISLSTDKKDEGKTINDLSLLPDQTISIDKDSTFEIISPVMGLNNKLGSLVIDYSK